MNEKLQQAIATSKAELEAQGYTVKTGDYELMATKGIYEVCEGYHENGQQQYIRNYKNDKRHGKQEGYHENGQKAYIHNYQDGKYHGQQEGWYDNGQQQYICNHKDGKTDGKQFAWKEDGTKKPTLVYKDGKFITEIISKQITYAEYKAIQRSKFWNGVFWIGSIVLFVGLFLADICFEINLFN